MRGPLRRPRLGERRELLGDGAHFRELGLDACGLGFRGIGPLGREVRGRLGVRRAALGVAGGVARRRELLFQLRDLLRLCLSLDGCRLLGRRRRRLLGLAPRLGDRRRGLRRLRRMGRLERLALRPLGRELVFESRILGARLCGNQPVWRKQFFTEVISRR